MIYLKKLILSITPSSVIHFSKKYEIDHKSPADHSTNSKSSQLQEDGYEPYNFGNTDQPLSYLGALLHFTKYIIGTGILAIPFAFKNVGYLIGLLGMIFVASLYVHVIHTLLSTEYELCKRLRVPYLTYVQVVENTFSTTTGNIRKLGFSFVSFVYFNYVFNGITGNTVYLLIIAGNMKCIYDTHSDTNYDITYFITLTICPLIVLCWIPKLRFLIPFSMVTNIFNFVNIILILLIPSSSDPKRDTPQAVSNIFFFPQFVALVLSALSGTGLLLPIKNDMAQPKYFASTGGVMNMTIMISGIVYTLFGLLGYLKYGEMVQGNVLLNLPKEELLSMLVYILYTLGVCTSFILNFYICFDTIWSNYLREKVQLSKMSDVNIFVLKNGLKIFICAASYLIAIAIPQFALFSSLTGSFGILTELCIPPLLKIFLYWSDVKNNWVTLNVLKNIITVLIGLCLCVSGFVGSIEDIIEFYT